MSIDTCTSGCWGYQGTLSSPFKAWWLVIFFFFLFVFPWLNILKAYVYCLEENFNTYKCITISMKIVFINKNRFSVSVGRGDIYLEVGEMSVRRFPRRHLSKSYAKIISIFAPFYLKKKKLIHGLIV